MRRPNSVKANVVALFLSLLPLMCPASIRTLRRSSSTWCMLGYGQSGRYNLIDGLRSPGHRPQSPKYAAIYWGAQPTAAPSVERTGM
jgi:hypothetical protein